MTVDELKARVAELETEVEALRLYRALAATDPLTGLPNRRAVEQRLSEELSRFRRTRAPVSIAVIDVDAFHAINEREGYVAGDRLLQTLAQTLIKIARDYDVVGRIGGDRFAVILPGVDRRGCERFVERFRDAFAAPVTIGAAAASVDSVADSLLQEALADLVRCRRDAAEVLDTPLPLDGAIPVDVVDATLASVDALLVEA